MSNKMKAWVLFKPHDMQLVEKDIPAIKSEEALVKIKTVGICGSDLHYYKDGKIGPFVVTKPLILGHECSGEVVAVKSSGKRMREGDHVVIEPGIPCMRCWHCKNGRYNKCPDIAFMATPPYDGCLVEYVSWPIDFLYKMPDGMSFQTGALVEPYTCSLAAIRRGGFWASANAVILGAGPIGLMVLETLKSVSAGDIYVVDVMEYRLDIAKKMGAFCVINAGKTKVRDKIRELTDGEGAHFVFETAGTNETYSLAPLVARNGGTLVCLGLLLDDGTPMPMSSLVINEINLVSIFRYSNVFEEAIRIIKNGRVNLSPILTHQFDFKDAAEAFDFSENNKDKSLKVAVNF